MLCSVKESGPPASVQPSPSLAGSASAAHVALAASTSRILAAPVYAPKCLCVTSHWPFYTQFERFLRGLHEHMTRGMVVPWGV